MRFKSVNVKNFISETGTKNQLFVFVGSNDAEVSSGSPQTAIDIWKQSDFSVKIGQNSLSAVVPNVKWQRSKPYIPWSSKRANTDNYYAYNEQNGYVYLCISDNELNRIDFRGNIVSTVRPTHIAGIQRYSDGYAWRPLYKVTPAMQRFVTTKWLPVVSFETFEEQSQQSQLLQVQEYCGTFGTDLTGKCAIYSKKAISTDLDSETIEYQIGDLFTTASNITCGDCYYLMKNNENFASVFHETNDIIPSNITINDKFATIGNLVQSGRITTSSPYYYLYNVNVNDNLEEGSIVSALIDLSSFTSKQLISNVANPELTVTSNTGSGGRIRLLTTISQDNYVISGIEIISIGSDYKDISVSVPDGVLTGALLGSSLVAKIEINLDTIDGLGFDPVDVLSCENVMIDARLDTRTLNDSGIILPNNVNFFGLVQNPAGISGSASVGSGSNLNKKLDYVFRTTVKASVDYTGGDAATTDELVDITYEKGTVTKTNSDVKVGGTIDTGSDTQLIEFKNVIYDDADDLIGGTITTKTSTITTIVDKPVFQQYSGKTLSTTKLASNLPVADVDSVIIRINMVKGM